MMNRAMWKGSSLSFMAVEECFVSPFTPPNKIENTSSAPDLSIGVLLIINVSIGPFYVCVYDFLLLFYFIFFCISHVILKNIQVDLIS